jgi:hypothetical protein
VKGRFVLHLRQSTIPSFINAFAPVGELQDAQTGSNGVEYAFAIESAPSTCREVTTGGKLNSIYTCMKV